MESKKVELIEPDGRTVVGRGREVVKWKDVDQRI